MATGFKNSPVVMQAYIVEGLELSIAKAKAPKSKVEKKPYNKQPIPMMVLRHQGEAWQNPFAAVYQSYQGKAKPAISQTTRLMDGNTFKGVKVEAQVEGKKFEQYVLIQQKPSDHYVNKAAGIHFTGAFGIVTLVNGALSDLYIGKGSKLSYQQAQLKVNGGAVAAYQQY